MVQAVVDDPSRSRTSSRWSARLSGPVLPASVLIAVLTALLVGVVAGSSIDEWDLAVYRWAPAEHWPELGVVLHWWVMLGQRAICLAIAAAWLGLRAWRDRDLRPLGVLLVATLLTNVGVGAMKALVGRLGPLQLGAGAGLPGATEVFVTGGTVFPSGHTANAVVTWGVLALVARRHRRLGAAVATAMAVSVGLTTVYLGTHWLSDVVAGWCAGGLVLLCLPTAVPLAARLGHRARLLFAVRRRSRRAWLSTAGSR
jgi:membrane-associated phospholipid phosphatase